MADGIDIQKMKAAISYPPVKLPGSRQDGMTYDFDSEGKGLGVSVSSHGNVKINLSSAEGKILHLDLSDQDAKTLAYLILQGAEGDCEFDGQIN